MTTLLLLWLLALGLLLFVAVGWRRGGALTLAYFLGSSLIHVPGAFAHASSAYVLPTREATVVGFQYTLIAMYCLVAGAFLARMTSSGRGAPSSTPTMAEEHELSWLYRSGVNLFFAGAVSYFVILPVAGAVPSLAAPVSAFASVLIIGLWLQLYAARGARKGARQAGALAALPLLPVATLAGGGFLGYAVYWIISVGAFVYTHSRRQLAYLALAPLAAIAGLSVYVAYMEGRAQIRDTVWRQQAALETRLSTIGNVFTDLKPFDISNRAHLELVDLRLNQNILVGILVERHQGGQVELAHGSSLSPVALIPRALWPNKPQVGGGGELVTRFTGIRFAPGTSVGSGQVFELYANFGLWGLGFGFFGLGWLLRRLDANCEQALVNYDVRGLLRAGLPGVMLLQPGGELVEIAVGVAAAMVAARAAEAFLPARTPFAPDLRGRGSRSLAE